MKEFDINNKIFDIPIETPPSNQYNPKYIIDKDKVQLMLKYNNGAIVWRYIKGFDNNYILGCNGEMWRYDKRKNDWVKVRFTQVKDSFQTKLLDSNKKRHTKKLNLLMKETFPELITYNKIKIELVDERLTTVSAHKTMNLLEINKHKKRGIVDTISAEYILETYLNKI